MKMIYGLSDLKGTIYHIGISTDMLKGEPLEIVADDEAEDRLVWWKDYCAANGIALTEDE